jgi:hypothetical protein
MNDAEKELIETKFEGLAELFEVKLSASVEAICEKVTGVEKNTAVTKKSLDDHLDWHNNLNKKIVGVTIKAVVVVLAVTVITTLVLGFKDGFLTAAVAKMIGP